jgi:acetylornithine/N-succinyldiaminopimelate aminotransferase
VIRTIAGDGLLDHVKRVGEQIRRGAEALGLTVRGAGLLLGIVLDRPSSAELATKLRAAGYLVNPVQPDVIRLAPPLILSAEQADGFLGALGEAIA